MMREIDSLTALLLPFLSVYTPSHSPPTLLPTFSLSTGSQSSCWHFRYLLCLFAEHFIAIDFRCQLQAQPDGIDGRADGQADERTDGQTAVRN